MGIILGGSTAGFCFPSLITWLCSESRYRWPADLEVLLVRPMSLFENARPAQPRRARVREEEG